MKREIASVLAVCLGGMVSGHSLSQQKISGSNNQTVVVTGAVVNVATGSATAITNIGSVKGTDIKGNNRQTVYVKGSVINSAGGRAHSEINIGSVTR